MRIDIIAKGLGWDRAPENREEKDHFFWGISGVVQRRYVDAVFDMHPFREWITGEIRTGKHARSERIKNLEMSKGYNIPIYALEAWNGLTRYPIEEIVEHFDTDLFASSLDYAMAMAIKKNPDKINLYGTTLLINAEYKNQLPTFMHWCGRAKERGIKVNNFTPETSIMKIPKGLVYGYNIPQKDFKEAVRNGLYR